MDKGKPQRKPFYQSWQSLVLVILGLIALFVAALFGTRGGGEEEYTFEAWRLAAFFFAFLGGVAVTLGFKR